MKDVTDIQRCQIFRIRTAVDSMMKWAEKYGVSRTIVLNIMTDFEKDSRIKLKFSDRNRRTITEIGRKDHKPLSPKLVNRLMTNLRTWFAQKIFLPGAAQSLISQAVYNEINTTSKNNSCKAEKSGLKSYRFGP